MRSAAAPCWSLREMVPCGRPRAWLALILLLAAVLRVLALDTPLYVDEIASITVATQPLASMAAVMRQIDASPALYPLLLHAWLGVSHADAWARLLSAIFGWLLVPVVALIACRLFDWRAALAAAFVASLAPAHIHYAQYVRSYSLFTLLAALHLLVFIDWMDDRVSLTRTRRAVFVGLTCALFYTHYLSPLLLVAEGVAGLLAWRRRRARVLAWGGGVAIAAVLFLPGVPLLLHNLEHDRVRNADRAAPPPLVRLVPDLIGELSLGQRRLGFTDPGVRRATLAGAALLFPALVIVAVRRGWRGRREAVVLLLLVAALPLALYVGSGRRLVAVRFFLPFMTAYLVLLGYGLASLGRAARLLAAGALAVVCAIPLWHFSTRFSWSYDHRRVAQAIDAASEPGDVLLFVHPYEQLYYRWYLDERFAMRGLSFTALEDQEGYVIKPPPLDFEMARARLLATAARHPRLWLIGQSTKSFASDAVQEARLLSWLDANFERAADLGGLTNGDPAVRLYVAKRQ